MSIIKNTAQNEANAAKAAKLDELDSLSDKESLVAPAIKEFL